MRIDPRILVPDNSGSNRVTDGQSVASKGASSTAASSAASEPNYTVQLSDTQATVRNLAAQLAQVPDVRETQISSLRSEVQSGQFQRSDAAVASAVVAQLLGANS